MVNLPRIKPVNSVPASTLDFRSDTVTRPTDAMRQVMANAIVGDDVFGDDPSVIELETKVAQLFGKEAAIFVPSSTMGNQIAVRLHCGLGEEALVHERCHIHQYEGGGAAALSGVTLRTIQSTDGTLPLHEVRARLHLSDDVHRSQTRMFSLENTNNACGGTVVPLEHCAQLAELAAAKGIKMHLDGARAWNAAHALGASLAEVGSSFDTIQVCFSKGLGAPVGGALIGTADDIHRARRVRKMFGGGMRQAGILAAAAQHALDHHFERMLIDHTRARRMASALAEHSDIHIDLELVQSNLVYFELSPDHPLSGHDHTGKSLLIARLAEAGLLATGAYGRYRVVPHLNHDEADIDRAIQTIRAVVDAAGSKAG